jgi:hypothetical protein
MYIQHLNDFKYNKMNVRTRFNNRIKHTTGGQQDSGGEKKKLI